MNHRAGRRPTKARRQKHGVDIAMGALFAILACPVQPPQAIHVGLGLLFLTLLGIHVYQHRPWLKALGRGRWPTKRRRATALIGGAALALALCVALGIACLGLDDGEAGRQLGRQAGILRHQGFGLVHWHYAMGLLAAALSIAHALPHRPKRRQLRGRLSADT